MLTKAHGETLYERGRVREVRWTFTQDLRTSLVKRFKVLLSMFSLPSLGLHVLRLTLRLHVLRLSLGLPWLLSLGLRALRLSLGLCMLWLNALWLLPLRPLFLSLWGLNSLLRLTLRLSLRLLDPFMRLRSWRLTLRLHVLRLPLRLPLGLRDSLMRLLS